MDNKQQSLMNLSMPAGMEKIEKVVADYQVFRADSGSEKHTGTGDSGSSGSIENNPQVTQLLSNDLCRIQ